MPKGGRTPRQPLAQRRPKAAANRQRLPKAPPPVRAAATTPPPARPKASRRPRVLRGEALIAQAREVWKQLTALYPDAHCELDYSSPWQLLVATILSAQCTDKRVNMVTPELFRRWPAPADLAVAPTAELEDVIRTTGFFRAKARSLLGAANAIVSRHGGAVPRVMADLVALPGVGRKTANVVLGNAFHIDEGVVVDTHVGRLAVRLGLTNESDPVKVEQALMAVFPRDQWTLLSHLLIWHGRRLCDARRPRCGDCPLRPACPSAIA